MHTILWDGVGLVYWTTTRENEMIELTLAKVDEATARIVASKPEGFCYERPEDGLCVYSYDGAPSCLVGHVLVDLGLPVEIFEERGINYDTDADDAIVDLEEAGEVSASTGVNDYLMSVQNFQDKGRTWLDSLMEARRVMGIN